MASALEAFTSYVATKCSLTVGTTLFARKRPDNAPDKCTCLYTRTGGRQDGKSRTQEIPIQMLTRAATAKQADDEAWRIYNALVNLDRIETGGFRFSITGNSPGSIGPDARGREEISTNLILYAKEV